jgi:hypothetical protein
VSLRRPALLADRRTHAFCSEAGSLTARSAARDDGVDFGVNESLMLSALVFCVTLCLGGEKSLHQWRFRYGPTSSRKRLASFSIFLSLSWRSLASSPFCNFSRSS